ncbi:MAG: serine/threonine-protein kinase [Anaerolineae bacterium]|nr:serine/threonine-protein kinase [Anaerolineae bacterium]
MVGDPFIGSQLGNFRVERLLGRGGMAAVYYGHDVMLDRPVAIKIVDRRYRDNEAYTTRFLREARAVARWRHEHIIQVYHVGEQDGVHYMVMEYVPGGDLASLLAEHRATDSLLPVAEVLRIGRAVAIALDFAHSHGVIHRDVKPGNVLLADDGRVVLSDFGLVMDTTEETSGDLFGSPHYVAPEQARRSSQAVPASDLYSLGVVLYEMLVGRRPFDDASPATVALQHLMEPPPPPRQLNPDLSPGAEVVLLRALAKEPDARYPSGAALMAALEAALATAGEPSFAPRPLRVYAVEEHAVAPVVPAAATIVEAPPRHARPDDTAPRPSMPPAPARWLPGIPRILLLAIAALLILAVILTYAALRNVRPQAANGGVALVTPGADESPPPPSVIVAEGEQGEEAAGAPPAARRLRLLYNDDTFYAANPNNTEIEVSFLRFDALDAGGSPAGYSFSGERWAVYYPFLHPGNCDRLHLINREMTFVPGECGDYNAFMTPEANEDITFWRAREGITHFAVFWDGVEVGRCEIAAGFCEVTIP